MVGETRFELATLWSQTRCATRLRHSPIIYSYSVCVFLATYKSENYLIHRIINQFSHQIRLMTISKQSNVFLTLQNIFLEKMRVLNGHSLNLPQITWKMVSTSIMLGSPVIPNYHSPLLPFNSNFKLGIFY